LPDTHHPATPEELRRLLAAAAAAKEPIELFGANTKRLMGGPLTKEGVRISTLRMQRIVQYEPRDLTISVEAGMPFAELTRELARNGQMIPLEGPYSDDGTVGGVVAANVSGPRRRLYGTARDMVIGMTFATLDGKLVQTGGMVVKNVAGLDMGKLMIGSFGTLAAIATVNFKLLPRPHLSRTVLFTFDDVKAAFAARDAAIRGVLNPVAVDVLNPILAAPMSLKGYVLALMFAGSAAVIERCHRDAAKFGACKALSVEEEQRFWHALRNVTPRHLEKFKEGAVARVSTTLQDCGAALASVEGAGHAHAASGIVRAWFSRPEGAARWLNSAVARGWKGVIEFSGEAARPNLTLWPAPGGDFEIMKRVKNMFDPEGLLNSGRLYGLI
jgi:glycolate oxidase FAD binding subunit